MADAYGAAAVGVVMTGMGRDGAEGLRAIRAAGGATFVQDRATCVVFGMPQAALQTGAATEAVALDRIAERSAAELQRVRAAVAATP